MNGEFFTSIVIFFLYKYATKKAPTSCCQMIKKKKIITPRPRTKHNHGLARRRPTTTRQSAAAAVHAHALTVVYVGLTAVKRSHARKVPTPLHNNRTQRRSGGFMVEKKEFDFSAGIAGRTWKGMGRGERKIEIKKIVYRHVLIHFTLCSNAVRP